MAVNLCIFIVPMNGGPKYSADQFDRLRIITDGIFLNGQAPRFLRDETMLPRIVRNH